MTEQELALLAKTIAPIVREAVATAVRDAETRVAVLEAQVKAIGDLRDRVVTIETKAATPVPSVPEPTPVDLSQVLERIAAAETRLSVLGDLRDRVVTVETKAAIPLSPDPGLSDLRDRLLVVETKAAQPAIAHEVVAQPLLDVKDWSADIAVLRERIVVVETKAAQLVMPLTVEPPSQVDLSPMHERVAAAETRLAVLGDLRDRVVTIETKAAQPVHVPAPVDVAPILAAVTDLTKEHAVLRERIAVAEVRPLMAGPAGADGRDGLAGKDGLHGKDGADGLGWDDLAVTQVDERTFTVKCMRGVHVKELGTLTFPVEIYRGVYVEGKTYDRGDGVTWGGSEWHANETTATKPGDGSKAWTLRVKRGRDGKDGRDAMSPPPVISIGKR